jgi:hypothetical protein
MRVVSTRHRWDLGGPRMERSAVNPLHLHSDLLGAAIRARAAQPALIVWVHRPKRDAWCILRRATGGRNIFLCCDWSPGNEPVHILTSALDDGEPRRPHNACPACSTELAARTPGAVAVDEANLDDLDDAPTPVLSRTPTPRMRRPGVAVEAWDAWWNLSRGDGEGPDRGDADDGAFDHLNDLRPEEP